MRLIQTHKGLSLILLALVLLLPCRVAFARPGDAWVVSYGGRDLVRWGQNGDQFPTSYGFGNIGLSTAPFSDVQALHTINHTHVVLTATQLDVLHGTPYVLPPAAITGETISLVGPINLRFTYPASGGVAYTGGGNTGLEWTTGPVLATGVVANTVIQATASSENLILPIAGTPVIGDTMQIITAGSNFAAGNGTLTVDYDWRQF